MSLLDKFLKRSSDEVNANPAKRVCKQICPHAIKCYRRNPHHFSEYDHPHLNDLLEKGDNPEIPTNVYIEDTSIVMDQLKILKDLNHPSRNVQNEMAESKPSTSGSGSSGTKCVARQMSMSNINKFGNNKNMSERLEANAPYNLFFTTIPDSPRTHTSSNCIKFTDLLCPSLGELKCSLQINFMIDIAWLMEQYNKANQGKKPLTILYGDEFPDMKKYIKLMLSNVTEQYVKPKDPFGIHHSKIGIYVYTDNSLRVVVSTANLYFEDWNYYNQGLWISPRCPVLPETTNVSSLGESPTNFKTSLLAYLNQYNLPVLKEWICYVKNADFSAVRVCLVTSTPGKHNSLIQPSQCHLHALGKLLSDHCVLPKKTGPSSEGPLSWCVNIQASSIGNLGKNPGDWLRGSLLRSLASHKDCRLPMNSDAIVNVIFPTKKNVLNSYYGPKGGGCLPYSKVTHEKQKWLHNYLHNWKADHTSRTRVMPHIKTYCRISPCTTKLAWFLLTSANISKAAWGAVPSKDGLIYVRSYEAGVLFLPKYFDKEYLQIKSTGNEEESSTKLFPFIYDLPLSSYQSGDEPWCN